MALGVDLIGRRPNPSGGNSNGDLPMLAFSGVAGRPALRLLLLHDAAEREFDCFAEAEGALVTAEKETSMDRTSPRRVG